MDSLSHLLDLITTTLPKSRAHLRRLKAQVASLTAKPFIANDALLDRYRQDVTRNRRPANRRLEQILQLNGVRSQSGIATVTVITEPYPCPGRCVYCPTEARAPKSYLTNEPAVMRALRNDYDPYRQVISRLRALDETGHATEKIELIIKGGTWSFYLDSYQRWFMQRCVEAANAFTTRTRELAHENSQPHNGHAHEASGDTAQTLAEAQRRNETAQHRIIGVTIETRPDYVHGDEIRRLRELGVTRVELGVQTLDDDILRLIVRDHTTAEIRQATKWLRDAGFKVAYHLMPNLPGATPEGDRETFRQLFDDPAYRPDTMKIYPCVVIKSAELYTWWREGRYQPYDDETLTELLSDLKILVPPYVRIERVIRDIPSSSIEAGSQVTNLRQEVHRRMRAQGRRCRCIRCRQVCEDSEGDFRLVRREYEASGGQEIFLSFEDPQTDRLASLLRLRLPASLARGARHWIPALEGAALIRELHTYGTQLSLHERNDDAIQHRGFGRSLLTEAERIASEEYGIDRMAVIAGVGVRDYYRRLGYTLQDTYMVKTLACQTSSNGHSLDGIS